MRTNLFFWAVLVAAILAGCAREQLAPATPSTAVLTAGDDLIAAEAKNDQESEQSGENGLDREAFSKVYTACVMNASAVGYDPSKCDCVKQAFDSGIDPRDVCAKRGATLPAEKSDDKAKTESESSADDALPLPAAPVQLPPMYVGIVGEAQPRDWTFSPSVGFSFDRKSFPRSSDRLGNEVSDCDAEFAVEGAQVAWFRFGPNGLVPVVVRMSESGEGLPVATQDGRVVAGNVTSYLPRGETGHIYLSQVIGNGKVEGRSVHAGEHDMTVVCGHIDWVVDNRNGPLARIPVYTRGKMTAAGFSRSTGVSGNGYKTVSLRGLGDLRGGPIWR